MICIQLTPEHEKEWYDHCLTAVDVKHSPPFYKAQCKAFIKSYEMKHGVDLPTFMDPIHGDKDE